MEKRNFKHIYLGTMILHFQTYKKIRQICVKCAHETHKFLPTSWNTFFRKQTKLFLRVQFNFYVFFAVSIFLHIIWLLFGSQPFSARVPSNINKKTCVPPNEKAFHGIFITNLCVNVQLNLAYPWHFWSIPGGMRTPGWEPLFYTIAVLGLSWCKLFVWKHIF